MSVVAKGLLLDIYGLFDDYEKLVSNLLQGNKGYHPVDGFL